MFLELAPVWLILLFGLAAVVIAVFGSMLTRLADRLADVTGMGEALMGAVLLGGTTSIPGIVTSVTAAFEGHAELAVSNAIGGIAAQTVFLALADIAYRKANLEHAAASMANMMQGAILVCLLALCILGVASPGVTFFGVHPVSYLLVGAYLLGLRQISLARTEPMWTPRRTRETRLDEPTEEVASGAELVRMALGFAGLGLIVGIAGYVVAETGIALSVTFGISETIVGGLLTAVATSLPELVTSIAAVRQGALTLAVGGIIGGNCFDVLFVAFSDAAYREGSIYQALTARQTFMIALTILLSGILLMGLLRREKHGIGNIGFESFLLIVLYAAMFGFLAIF